ncbi:MAG: hypothetical protein EAX96_07670 [Candidatus Lokiarchaeota archaeon]|nr:hypothetical protein [Candidatus Lokiarchaeota archaeon]
MFGSLSKQKQVPTANFWDYGYKQALYLLSVKLSEGNPDEKVMKLHLLGDFLKTSNLNDDKVMKSDF